MYGARGAARVFLIGVAYLNGLRDDVRAERHLDATSRSAANGHVEEDDWVGHCAVCVARVCLLERGGEGRDGSRGFSRMPSLASELPFVSYARFVWREMHRTTMSSR